MSKDKAKSFMFICIGLAALAGAFNLGAGTAVGQAENGEFVSITLGPGGEMYAVTESGDTYFRENAHPYRWHYQNNVLESSVRAPSSR